MSLISDVLSVGIGLAVGESVADSIVDDDNQVTHLAVGITGAGIASSLTKTALKESGIDSMLDDIFDF